MVVVGCFDGDVDDEQEAEAAAEASSPCSPKLGTLVGSTRKLAEQESALEFHQRFGERDKDFR